MTREKQHFLIWPIVFGQKPKEQRCFFWKPPTEREQQITKKNIQNNRNRCLSFTDLKIIQSSSGCVFCFQRLLHCYTYTHRRHQPKKLNKPSSNQPTKMLSKTAQGQCWRHKTGVFLGLLSREQCQIGRVLKDNNKSYNNQSSPGK